MTAVKRLLPLLLFVLPLAAERYTFRAYGQREGLLNPIIRMMAQDAAGFFWVVTAHGVYRFDGERMEYMHGRGLPETDVRWVHCAADGAVWFRAANRIYRQQKGQFTVVAQADAAPREAPQTLSTDATGALWLVTGGQRLERIRGSARETMRVEKDGLWSVLIRRDGAAVAGCGNRICEWRDGVWSAARVPADRYVTFHETSDGTTYARGRQRVVRRPAGETAWEDLSRGLPPLSPDQPVPALATDFHRRLLTNTETGLARFENGRWQVIDERKGLVDLMVRSITVDREGGIWLGTYNGMWRWLGDGAWRLLGAAAGLPRRGTEMAAQDKHGDVWVTTGPAGVFRGRQSQGEWRFAEVKGLPPATALITVYRDDAVWFGPQAGGILRRDTATGSLSPVAGADPRAAVYDFSIDHEGRVVAVTRSGFYRERAPNVLELVYGGKELYALAEDADGRMWLGGDGVIARVDGSRVEVFTTSDGVENNGIRAIHPAPDGRIWTGTWRMDGLRAYRLEGKRLIALHAADEPADRISTFFIRRDRGNRVWAGTVRGMTYFEAGRWHVFGRPQGLSADHCTHACFLRDGSIWFATSSGLAQFTPPVERRPQDPPTVVLKGAEARFGPVDLLQAPALHARESDLEIDYGVLSTSLDAPPHVRYRLQAEEPWREARQRPLSFLGLAPGHYRLELAAQGLNGAWSAAPLTLPFRVLPFWWQTWWFRAAAAGALTGVAVWGWKWRQRAAQRKNLEQLRAMIDRYPGVVFVLDRDGRFVITNRRLEEYTFQPPAGLIGKTPRDVMSPANATQFERNFHQAWERGKLWEYSETYRVAGGVVVFDISAFPLRDARGEIEAICAFAADVTERRRLEQERDQARERYQAFVQRTKEAIWRTEFEPPIPVDLPPREFGAACYERGIVREANQAAAAILGVPLEELIGARYVAIRDRFIPDSREIDRAWYENGFQLRDHEYHAVTASGEERRLLTDTIGIVENGHLARNWTTQRDVTGQRRAERERDQARQRYEAFVQQTQEAIWRVEFEPPVPVDLPPEELVKACGERGVVREANQAAAEFLGRPLAGIIGQTYASIRDRHLPVNRAADQAWCAAGFQLREFESQVTDARGETRVLMANTVGIVENGCLVRSWSTQRDITGQRRLEELVANTARGVSASTGQRFFELLVRHLAQSLRADCAVAGERMENGDLRILAVEGDHTVPPLRIDWPALGQTQTYAEAELPDLLGQACPAHLKTCMLVPMVHEGVATGVLLAGYGSATALPEQARAALEIFAARAGAELARIRGERQVLHYQEQLRALTARTQQIAENERAHFAREIHDELGQMLTAIKIGLSTARSRIGKGALEQALEQMGHLTRLAEEGVHTVRRVSTELRPPALDQLGLVAAIRWQVKEAQQRLGIPVECRLEEVETSSDVAIAAFRILQECLTNIMRHAHATHVQVHLRGQENRLHLTVSDNGYGFDPASRQGGSLGLLGMSERAAAVGGEIKVESVPGDGTTIVALLPLT